MARRALRRELQSREPQLSYASSIVGCGSQCFLVVGQAAKNGSKGRFTRYLE